MPKTSTAVLATTTTEVKLEPRLKRQLLMRLRTYEQLKNQLEVIKSAMDKEKGFIEDLRQQTGETSIAIDGFKVTLVCPVRTTLDKKKLIEQGVSIAQIERATVTTPGKDYTKVTVQGAKEDE